MKGFRTALLVAAVAGLAALYLLPVGAVAQQTTRTHVVDALDDNNSNRFVSADNGTSDITVEVGDTVRWEFDEAMMGHTVTRNSQNWDISEYRDPGGAPVEYTFTKPGEYRYLCTLHGGMTGTVNVVADAPNQAPTVTAGANPATGDAPLSVAFTANGQDPQGDALTYSWDFGVTGTDTDKATGNRVSYQYGQPGTYTATVTARDPGGNEGTGTVQVTVNGDPAPPAPEIEALADPGSGEAPLGVAFSTRLTTRGEFEPFGGGPAEYAGVGGTAELSRSRDETVGAVHVTGLEAGARYEARVHTEPCSTDQGGPGFRFDPDRPEGTPGNEILMPFTADEMGMGMGGASQERRAGDGALSVVVHDVADNRRAACATFEPDPADLTYSWDFDGDGVEDSTGPDPTHTYTAPGSYAAELTVSNTKGGETVSDTVAVDVSAANEPPDTEITAGPTGATNQRGASFWFLSTEPGEGAGFECSMDGAAFATCSSPQGYENLPSKTHTFRVRAVDASGEADGSPASRTWTVDTAKPSVGGLNPKAGSSTRDRTPEIQASAKDSQTDLARGDIALSLDGRKIPAFAYDRTRNVLRHVPTNTLSYGAHTVRVTTTDAAGNTTAETWRFKVGR